MALSNERGLNYESVSAACELLVSQGYLAEGISLRDIRNETTEGSLSTIRKHRERWHRGRRDAALAPVHIDDSELDGLRAAIEQLYSKKTSDMRAEVEAGASTARATLERLEMDLEEALKSNDHLRGQCEDAIGLADQLRVEVAAANFRANELAAANAKLRDSQRMGLADVRPLHRIPEAGPDAPVDQPLDNPGKGASI